MKDQVGARPSPMSTVVVAPSPIHGRGVFASGDFGAGETILVIEGSRVIDDGHPFRPELAER